MRCNTKERQLQLYIDGRLPLSQMRNLEMHLATCASCRETLQELEIVAQRLEATAFVTEPGQMHAQIMQRVSVASAVRREAQPFLPWRPSLVEWLSAVLLATVATLGSILQQPSLRAMLPIANGHDSLSLAFLNVVHTLTTMDSSTLSLALWIIGTLLGICITLVLAGTEMRSRWFKAMTDHLPVR